MDLTAKDGAAPAAAPRRAPRALIFDSGLGGLSVLAEIGRLRHVESSRSGLISVLATTGTIARDYGRALVRDHAAGCEVTLVGSALLPPIAERAMRGEAVDEASVGRKIAPCFVEMDGRRTDHVVLACTHFPLILDALERVAPWPVAFVDPAAAIARRLDALIGPAREDGRPRRDHVAIFTSSDAPQPELEKALRRFALTFTPSATIGSPPP